MRETNHVGLVSLDEDGHLLAAAHDLRGLTVVDPYGHRLGEVDGLVGEHSQGTPRLLVVSSGGILSLGRTRRLVPVEVVARIDEVVHIDASRAQVHDADFDLDLDRDPVGAYQRVCSHYGVTPMWPVGR
jgi:hypothetical protein